MCPSWNTIYDCASSQAEVRLFSPPELNVVDTSRKLGDHTYLTWNNEQETSATTTGRDDRAGPRSN